MAYIATLKKNNTVIYPQTKSTAVYEDDGVTALDTVVVKKSTAAADANKMIKADGTKALVGASNIDFTTLPGNYSTSEIDTGYTWIDGSHIYKKTVYCGTLPTTPAIKTTAHNVSNLGLCIRIEGVAYDSNRNITMSLPETANNISFMVVLSVTPTAIELQCDADRSSYDKVYVTIYYIKSS